MQVGARKKKRRNKREIWEIIIAFLSMAVTSVGLSALLKWGFWLISWSGVVVFIVGELPYRLPKKTRLAGCLILIVSFLPAFKNLIGSQWRTEQAAKLEGDLLGGPRFAYDNYVNMGIPAIQIGNSKTMLFKTPNGQVPEDSTWRWFEDAGLKLEWGKRGPLVTTPIRDRFGDLVVDVKRNHWKIYPPYCSDKNYRDDALEVLDNAGHVVLQLKLLSKGYQTVQIQGEWWNIQGQGRRLIEEKGESGAYILILIPTNQYNDKLIQPMFNYPSSDNWQVLADATQ